jgi:3-oxoadipate enol-lactonase
MPVVKSGQSELYYQQYGQGHDVVFLHGVGGNHASWFNQIPSFAKTYRVTTIDQRGFGNSTDAEGLGQAAFVADLKLLLDELRIDRVALIAQSMGGGTACGFTCAYPKRVSALVLADTLVGISLPDDLAKQLSEVAAKTKDLPQAERVLGPWTRTNRPESTLLYLQLASFNTYAFKTVKGKFAGVTLDQLSITGVPILYVAGAEENLFPATLMKAVHGRVPRSQYVEIPEAGHSAYFEKPELFNEAVLTFLRGNIKPA